MTLSDHLTPNQLKELHAELEAELQMLRRRVQRAATAGRPVELDQTSVGRLSHMDALQNQGLAAGAHARAPVQLAQVVDALARMEAGRYGFCHTCSRPIPYEQLSVMPEARECRPRSRGS
jgi:DnaK suppressor protein